MRNWLPASALSLLAACGTTTAPAPYLVAPTSDAIGAAGDISGSAAQPECFDSAAEATATCAPQPAGTLCALGDANACVPLTQIQVYADDGKTGACLHLVFQNNCAAAIYAYTCIEHTNPGGPDSRQCWTSSVWPGFKIDVSECRATGKYFFVSSTSSGQLDIYQKKCPAP